MTVTNTTKTHRTAVVCSSRTWVAKDLEQPGWDIVHNHGLWLPQVPSQDVHAWWMPMEHLAWLNVSGYPLALAAPGPKWLSTFHPESLGRTVRSCRVMDVEVGDFPAWVKLAEVKTDLLPSQWWDTKAAFDNAVSLSGASPLSWVQVSARVADVVAEYRFFVAGGRVTASAPYRLNDVWWDAGLGATDVPSPVSAFATRVAADVEPGPPAYTLDVGVTRDGGQFVIEVNPVFSSATYDADPAGVLEALAAAVAPDPSWAYMPDPLVAARVARKRPLTA
jgi:hypothetical protein